MRILSGISAGLAMAVVLASPAAGQSRTADRIAREIRDAAIAIGTVRDAVDYGLNDIRWSGPEREAVRMCVPRLERYGRVRIDQVRPHSRRSIRVYGTIDAGGWGSDRGYSRYSRYSRSSRYGLRSFTCTARYDGRVKIKTRRLRR